MTSLQIRELYGLRASELRSTIWLDDVRSHPFIARSVLLSEHRHENNGGTDD